MAAVPDVVLRRPGPGRADAPTSASPPTTLTISTADADGYYGIARPVTANFNGSIELLAALPDADGSLTYFETDSRHGRDGRATAALLPTLTTISDGTNSGVPFTRYVLEDDGWHGYSQFTLQRTDGSIANLNWDRTRAGHRSVHDRRPDRHDRRLHAGRRRPRLPGRDGAAVRAVSRNAQATAPALDPTVPWTVSDDPIAAGHAGVRRAADQGRRRRRRRLARAATSRSGSDATQSSTSSSCVRCKSDAARRRRAFCHRCGHDHLDPRSRRRPPRSAASSRASAGRTTRSARERVRSFNVVTRAAAAVERHGRADLRDRRSPSAVAIPVIAAALGWVPFALVRRGPGRAGGVHHLPLRRQRVGGRAGAGRARLPRRVGRARRRRRSG